MGLITPLSDVPPEHTAVIKQYTSEVFRCSVAALREKIDALHTQLSALSEDEVKIDKVSWARTWQRLSINWRSPSSAKYELKIFTPEQVAEDTRREKEEEFLRRAQQLFSKRMHALLPKEVVELLLGSFDSSGLVISLEDYSDEPIHKEVLLALKITNMMKPFAEKIEEIRANIPYLSNQEGITGNE